MNLLVVGADRVDAGKTTFSVGLCHRTGSRGYKPRAGHDYWFDHDDYWSAAEEGRLYGKDARRLADVSPGVVEPEAINPVHRLWLPTPGRGTGLLGRDGRQFICDRVRTGGSDHEGTVPKDVYVRNGTLDIPDSVRESLPLGDACVVDDLPSFNDKMTLLHRPATERVVTEASTADRAVVESYADIARPHPDVAADAVAVVEPRRCRIFDGHRYLKGCSVAAGSAGDGHLEERVGNVLELLEPVTTVELPTLTAPERNDPGAVATAYAPAYEALLSVAR